MIFTKINDIQTKKMTWNRNGWNENGVLGMGLEPDGPMVGVQLEHQEQNKPHCEEEDTHH